MATKIEPTVGEAKNDTMTSDTAKTGTPKIESGGQTIVRPAGSPSGLPPSTMPTLGGAAVKVDPAPMQQPVNPPVSNAPREMDQLSRIEDKAARIEEKFARYEAVLTRAEASLERSSQKVETAAGAMDFAGIREEVAYLRQRVEKTPRFGALVLTGIVTAVLTVVLTVLVLRFGVPGVLPALIQNGLPR